jgi:hypothetical protein
MIQVKPFPANGRTCPECESNQIHISQVLIEGVHAVSDNECKSCGFNFFQLLPVGHTVDYPLQFGKVNNKLYDTANAWVSPGLLQYFSEIRPEKVEFRKTVYQKHKNILILNTLDFLYGHALLKLLNAQHHLDRELELGLVIIIPKNFEWLIPAGCAEVWVADIPLSKLYYRHESIGKYITEELKRFDNVYLSKAYSHPDFTKISVQRFTGIPQFDLRKFSTLPITVTFILREDRWWLDHFFSYKIFQALRKAGLVTLGKKLLLSIQNRLVRKTIIAIKKQIPGTVFNIIGIGSPGLLGGIANDHRSKIVSGEQEKEWCELYSRSQVVIGVHGSNMILPTAHAAGCIEILPDDRLPNIAQDIAVQHTDRRQLFLYRLLQQFATSAAVASHTIAMITQYDRFYRDMCTNQYHN